MLRTRSRNQQGFKRASVKPGSNAVLVLRGVEGWRGVAALMVILVHVWSNMGTDGTGLGPGAGTNRTIGWIFGNTDIVVDLFFVLSAMLLWMPFAHAALDDSAQAPDPRSFLYRRAVRLFPIYWFLVVLMWSLENFGVGTAQWLDLFEHLLLIQSFDSERIFYTIGPAWTLSVEFMFYLSLTFFAPPFVRWVREVPGQRARVTRMIGAFAAVAAVSLLFKANVAYVWTVPVEQWAWRFGPIAKADDFAVGMVVATVLVLMRNRRLPGWCLPLFVGAGIACYWGFRSPPGVDPNLHFEVFRHPAAAVMWGLILLGVATTSWDWVPRAIDNGVAVRLSLITYSLYLVHEPVMLGVIKLGLYRYEPTVPAFLVNYAWLLLLTIPIAWVLHRVVEEPWTDMAALRDRNGRRRELYPDLVHYVPIVRIGTVEPGELRTRVLDGAQPSRRTQEVA